MDEKQNKTSMFGWQIPLRLNVTRKLPHTYSLLQQQLQQEANARHPRPRTLKASSHYHYQQPPKRAEYDHVLTTMGKCDAAVHPRARTILLQRKVQARKFFCDAAHSGSQRLSQRLSQPWAKKEEGAFRISQMRFPVSTPWAMPGRRGRQHFLTIQSKMLF